MDIISINRLDICCIIGCNPPERVNRQHIFVTVNLHCDCHAAGISDDLNDTVDYYALSQRIATLAEEGQFRLIEALAESICAHCLSIERVKAVDVIVEKPNAIKNAASASVSITREKKA